MGGVWGQRRTQRSFSSVPVAIVVPVGGGGSGTGRSAHGLALGGVDIRVLQFAVEGLDGLLEFVLERLLQGRKRRREAKGSVKILYVHG
jgi:hypothetical protein